MSVHIDGFVVVNGVSVDVENDAGSDECNVFDAVKLLLNWWELTGGLETSMIEIIKKAKCLIDYSFCKVISSLILLKKKERGDGDINIYKDVCVYVFE